MAQVNLSAEESDMLRQVLGTYLSDLRMEIADTEQMDFRENLKRQETFLKRLLEQLAADMQG